MQNILHALTDEGLSLPVIDLTHPSFALSLSDTDLANMSAAFLTESEQRREIPPQLREALSRSILGRALMDASRSYLGGVHTYLFKLGPENLGETVHPVDRQIAASFPAVCSRIRLQDMARLLADGLATRLSERPHCPLSLINIAGGPASDSWNALIYLQNECAAQLAGREITILVLDLESAGASFGARAVAGLSRLGRQFDGLRVSFRHHTYNWALAETLAEGLGTLNTHDAICAVSSEGGLFEYGSDSEICANLEELQTSTPQDAFVVGSVTRDSEIQRSSQPAGGISVRPRTLAAFRSLAHQSGWELEQVMERPFSFNVRMVKRLVPNSR